MVTFCIERHAQPGQTLNRQRRAFDHIFNGFLSVQPRPGDHRIADVIFKRIARIQHRGDAALCPCRRTAGQRPLGQHQHLEALCKGKRRRQTSSTRTDHDHICIHKPFQTGPAFTLDCDRIRCCGMRATGKRSRPRFAPNEPV
jgi:hypothetical protein